MPGVLVPPTTGRVPGTRPAVGGTKTARNNGFYGLFDGARDEEDLVSPQRPAEVDYSRFSGPDLALQAYMNAMNDTGNRNNDNAKKKKLTSADKRARAKRLVEFNVV